MMIFDMRPVAWLFVLGTILALIPPIMGMAFRVPKVRTVSAQTAPEPWRSLPDARDRTSWDKPSIRAYIAFKAWTEGLGPTGTRFMLDLANCESGFKPDLVNKTNNHPAFSRDRGLWQFSDFYHPEVSDACAFDVPCSTKIAISQVRSGDAEDWICTGIIRPKRNYEK